MTQADELRAALTVYENAFDQLDSQAKKVAILLGYFRPNTFYMPVERKPDVRSDSIRQKYIDMNDAVYYITINIDDVYATDEQLNERYGNYPAELEWVKAKGKTYGSLMTLEEFKDSCKSGCFIDYDGSGEFIKFEDGVEYEWVATKDWRGDIRYEAYPSSINSYYNNPTPEGATHVRWFNR